MNWRRPASTVALLGAAVGFFVFLASARSPSTWLAGRLALYAVASGVFLLSALALGHVGLSRLWPGPRRTHEHLALALALGTFGFEVLVFLFGLFDLYQPWAFFALPCVALGAGGPSLWRWFRRRGSALARARAASTAPPAWRGPLIAFGWVCVGLLWFSMLTPENVQFDSRWKHLAIAEDFVATGGLRRFPEGWIFAARPHASSYLYLWAFLAPGAELYDQMVLSMHLELVVFLGTTLWGIPALVRRLVRGADVRLVWVARFLFPGVLLYDGNLSAGADHIGAVFGPALALVVLRLWRRPTLGAFALVGVLAAAAFQVKETVGLMLLPPVALALAARCLLDLRASPRATLSRAALAAVAFVVAASPHWATNLAWYGDPLYPNFWRIFEVTPWMPSGPYTFETLYRDAGLWQPPRTLDGVLRTLRATVDFSFDPNNWGGLHGELPIVGSLYTLLLPAALFLRVGRRTWALVIATQIGLFAWFWVHHQDRYLQVIMPYMAAVTAAVLVKAWRDGGVPGRLGACALVGVQVVWAGDVPFIPTHAMIKDTPLRTSAALLSQGYKAKDNVRLTAVQKDQRALGKALPSDARVLMHEEHSRLGLRAQWITDYPGEQYALSYGDLDSPADVWDALRDLGATHVAWKPASRAFETIASDIRFFETAHLALEAPQRVGVYQLAVLPEARPTGEWATASGDAIVLSCPPRKPKDRPTYASGLYPISALRVRTLDKSPAWPTPTVPLASAAEAAALAGRARALVVDPRCHAALPAALKTRFEKRADARKGGRGDVLYQVWTLRRPLTPAAK